MAAFAEEAKSKVSEAFPQDPSFSSLDLILTDTEEIMLDGPKGRKEIDIFAKVNSVEIHFEPVFSDLQ